MKVWRKIILSYEAHFRLDGLLISKIFVFGEFTCDWRKTNAPATCHCLVRILARRHHHTLHHTFLRTRLVEQRLLMISRHDNTVLSTEIG